MPKPTEQPAAEQAVQPTQAELMAELQAALTKGDFKAVTAISRKIDTLTRAAEKAELDAKRAVLDAIAEDVNGKFCASVAFFGKFGEVSHVIGYAGYAEQPAFLVTESVQCSDIVTFFSEIKQDSRVEVT